MKKVCKIKRVRKVKRVKQTKIFPDLEFNQKIFKQGNSNAITIPYRLIKKLGLKKGKKIKLRLVNIYD